MIDDTQKKPAGESDSPVEGKKEKTGKAKPRKSKKAHTQIPQGKAYIQATYNNTIVSLTDMNGNVLAWSSAGVVGFKGPKKATPYAASVIVRDVVEKVKDFGLKEVSVFITGVGQGREGALRALNANGVGVLSMKDITPIPHNGCRPPRPRRV
ncbi:30S ribosomal protein S11 [Candidatus Uhrbacteria bacterium]|nr:30S ribosomal protein S11 [Candidatus Uhrbacteria bacterium]